MNTDKVRAGQSPAQASYCELIDEQLDRLEALKRDILEKAAQLGADGIEDAEKKCPVKAGRLPGILARLEDLGDDLVHISKEMTRLV